GVVSFLYPSVHSTTRIWEILSLVSKDKDALPRRENAAHHSKRKTSTLMPVINIPARNENSPFASMKGHHVAVRVLDFTAAKKWYVEKLDFRVVYEWPYADLHLAYLAPATDDTFFIQILCDSQTSPIPKPAYHDLGDSLRLAGFHHFCLNVTSVDQTIGELRR